MSMNDGKGRVAIVTGGGQGIGRAFCLGLAERGYRVVIAELDEANGASAEAAIKQGNGSAKFVRTDITESSAVDAMAEAALSTFGRIDILVNNARWSGLKPQPIEEITDDIWQKALAVNLGGAFHCSRAVVPHMKGQKWGRIVNMSSATFLMPPPRPYVHYVTTKAALLGMTRGLAVELGEFGITVNAILPGSVETGVERPGQPAKADRDVRALAHQAIKRREVPEDMVGALAFLVSDEASFITGQGLNVDGGYAFS
jgi:3-oxoacyl-[acyl-carrier protein] reductase